MMSISTKTIISMFGLSTISFCRDVSASQDYFTLPCHIFTGDLLRVVGLLVQRHLSNSLSQCKEEAWCQWMGCTEQFWWARDGSEPGGGYQGPAPETAERVRVESVCDEVFTLYDESFYTVWCLMRVYTLCDESVYTVWCMMKVYTLYDQTAS